jgi:uncharacterized membrane protein
LLQKNAFNKTKAITLTVVSIGLVIAYPFITYTLQRNQYGGFLPCVFALVLCWRALNASEIIQRFSLFAIAALLLAGALLMDDVTSQLIPVTIYLALIWFFGRTLFYPPPLIERFVRLQFAEIPDEVLNYCRQLTVVWTLLFVLIVIASLVLIATNHTWLFALLHGVITWLFMAALTVIEHVYRLNRFPFMKDQIPSIKATVQSAIKNKDQLW